MRSKSVKRFQISQYVFSKDKSFVFTLSKNEGNVFMWRVMTGALEVLAVNVGEEEAFKFENLLGPDRDFLLQEIKDYFVYANLIHKGAMMMGLNQAQIGHTVPACEVPDILRAMGCFMTNYEMECAIRKGTPREKFKIEEIAIDFTELVELYSSGREFSCVDMNAIRKAFYRICSMRTSKEGITDKETRMSISRTDFVHILTSKGEYMQMCEALHFLRTLVDPMDKSKAKVAMEKQKLADRNEEDLSVDFVFLPEKINYDYFVRNILGLDRKFLDAKETNGRQQELAKFDEDVQQRAQEKYQSAELAYRHKFAELGVKEGASLIKKDPCSKFNKKNQK